MWTKWMPWRMMIRNTAKRLGFLDPVEIFSRLEQFSQPSEVAAPIQLLRSGVVLHARGLINSQAIQHNLDWVWPYWVERQFNPKDISFIPRAFSITHINLSHRNWTAVGMPDFTQLPIVDPAGLTTPFFDSFSIDGWIITEQKDQLIPSKMTNVSQTLKWDPNIFIQTHAKNANLDLISTVRMVGTQDQPKCQIEFDALSQNDKAWLVVALRPYNPEGISFVHDVELLKNNKGWLVNKIHQINFEESFDQHAFSYYRKGDVYKDLPSQNTQQSMKCRVGLATAAAQFALTPNERKKIAINIPYKRTKKNNGLSVDELWNERLKGICQIKIPDSRMQFLFEAAIRTIILHSPEDVYPGPYTYKRFWFRDAAFILYAMLCVGFKNRVANVIDQFPDKQTVMGYFLSQEGEWDSNGEALWIMDKYIRMTNSDIPQAWIASIDNGGRWIMHKRLKDHEDQLHSGLLPPGFSAEHLGPNDYYFWDDFWGVAGLQSAARLIERCKSKERAKHFLQDANEFMASIEKSLDKIKESLKQDIIPASPYRRMDAGAIGSIVVDYPLQLWPAQSPRVSNTANFLLDHCFVNGGFFQDMTHSGVNPYLTLHVAQVLLRNADMRYFDLMNTVASLASPTGQWPEAIHPHTQGGCMGDGQHVWAAAEWVLMMRNCFIREEEIENKIVLCSGIPFEWIEKEEMEFGPVTTAFGVVDIKISANEQHVILEWHGNWYESCPRLEVGFPQITKFEIDQEQKIVYIPRDAFS